MANEHSIIKLLSGFAPEIDDLRNRFTKTNRLDRRRILNPDDYEKAGAALYCFKILLMYDRRKMRPIPSYEFVEKHLLKAKDSWREFIDTLSNAYPNLGEVDTIHGHLEASQQMLEQILRGKSSSLDQSLTKQQYTALLDSFRALEKALHVPTREEAKTGEHTVGRFIIKDGYSNIYDKRHRKRYTGITEPKAIDDLIELMENYISGLNDFIKPGGQNNWRGHFCKEGGTSEFYNFQMWTYRQAFPAAKRSEYKQYADCKQIIPDQFPLLD